ncbi:MAG: hypothetical protein U0326_08865 [Polyangiales bacterium]
MLEALDQSTSCAREAAADTAMNNRERILEACRALSASLAPQVGRVVVHVTDPPSGAVVRVAGSELNSALWGVSYPVVPGVVEIDAEGAPAARTHTAPSRSPRAPPRRSRSRSLTSRPSFDASTRRRRSSREPRRAPDRGW